VAREDTESTVPFDLPELNLSHLFRLSDDTGILQHAHYTIPDYARGTPRTTTRALSSRRFWRAGWPSRPGAWTSWPRGTLPF